MKKGNMVKQLIAMGILAMSLTGCGEAIDKVAAQGFDKAETTSFRESETWKEDVPGTQAVKDIQTAPEQSFVGMNAKEVDDLKLVQEAVDGFQKYFNVKVDPSQYDVKVFYFEEFKDLKASYSIDFSVPENDEILKGENSIGPDGFPLPEIQKKLKPEFYASFTGEKELDGLYLNYMGWKKSEVPLTVEEAKKVAEKFLLSHEMIVDGKIECLGSSIISSTRTSMLYANGKDGAIQIAVDIYSGEVEHFGYYDRADIVTSPVEEGFGVG